MEETKVTHQTINGKYRICIERAAVKSVDGFKVEVNSDDMQTAMNEIQQFYEAAEAMTYTEPVQPAGK